MARVWVSREELATGEFPQVCVVTGARADATVPVRFDSLPEWAWVLLLFGLFPFLIATAFATERVAGEVPVVREVVERYHRRRRRSRWLAAGGAALIVGGLLAGAAWVVGSGVLVVGAGTAVAVVASRGFVDGRPDRTGLWVSLSRVHPGFADALEAGG